MKSGKPVTVRPSSRTTGPYFEIRVYLFIFSEIFEKSLSLASFFWLIYSLNGIGYVIIFIAGILSWLLDSYGYFCGLVFDILENGILSCVHKTKHYAFVFGYKLYCINYYCKFWGYWLISWSQHLKTNSVWLLLLDPVSRWF